MVQSHSTTNFINCRRHNEFITSYIVGIITLFVVLVNGCRGLPTDQESTRIQCIECTDMSYSMGTRSKAQLFYEHPESLVACSTLNRRFIRHVKCGSVHDVCTKTITYGAGRNENGEEIDIVQRGCSTLNALFLNDLEGTKHKKIGTCYSERIPVSPPFKQRLCICNTNLCNHAVSRTSWPFVGLVAFALQIALSWRCSFC